MTFSMLPINKADAPPDARLSSGRAVTENRIQNPRANRSATVRTFQAIVYCVSLVLMPAAWAQPTVDFLVTNRLVEPHGIAIDGDNRVYITDSADHRIFVYDSDNGLLSNLAGVAGTRGSTNGPGFVAQFFSPKGIVLARGGLVIADSGNHQLRFIDLNGKVPIVSSFAGASGGAGFVDGPAGTARFNSPAGLAADPAGNIYVADSKNNAIRKIDVNNVVSTVATHFAEPSAVALGEAGELFVADTRNHAIKRIRADGTVQLLAGRGSTGSGTNDSFFAAEAQFTSPSGLIWLGPTTGLIVSDTGNHTLRRLFFDPIIAEFFPETSGYSVETYAGIPRQPGFEDGSLTEAKFNAPIGLARDQDNGLIVADLGNRALRRIQTAPRLPRVANPKIGYVTFVIDDVTGAEVSKLVPFTEAIFNNDITLAILAEPQTETFFTSGPTPSLFEADTIPVPTSNNSQPAPPYSDGLLRSQVRPSLLDPRPDITIKSISSAEGRRPSELVQARVQFKTATPVIVGDNPASFAVETDTSGAEIWYTLDGSAPTNAAPSTLLGSDTLSLQITNAVTFRARAFRRHYKPSEIATKTFYPSDFQANRISFGFSSGEASSQFLGAAGQRFIAPVTLSLLPGQKIHSLQFNLTVTNRNDAPTVTPGAFGFQSMLLELLPDGSFRRIDPKMFERNEIEVITNVVPTGTLVTTNFIEIFRDALVTNINENLLGVGWFEVIGKTNLYNTVGQDLITFSHAHDKRFDSSSGRVVVGGYSFEIPPAAASGSAYQIQINRPSGIEGELSRDVFIDTPVDGALGSGAVNAVKHVTVRAGGLNPGQLHYIVGDVAPFRWYNAGDFGDASVLNNDVFQIFRAATYGLNVPPAGSDFFDAMDACCNGPSGAVFTDVFDGSQNGIDLITHGDGILNVTDVFVVFRRSLDPSLKWFARFWSNSERIAAEIPNRFRGTLTLDDESAPILQPQFAARSFSPSNASNPAHSAAAASASIATPIATEAPSVTFAVDDLQIRPGDILAIPVRAEISGSYPLRVGLLNVTVEPQPGAVPISEPIQVVPAPELGAPTFSFSAHSANYAAGWLDHRIAGLHGNATLATIYMAVPKQPLETARYRVRIDHASASPNGLVPFPSRRIHGLAAATLPSGSSFNDGIPDQWRLRYFGSVYNHLAHADADADGDTIPNWQEFQSGTDPTDIHSQFRIRTGRTANAILLRWPTARGQRYLIEAAVHVAHESWVPIAEPIPGTGGDLQFNVSSFIPTAQFFRVRTLD